MKNNLLCLHFEQKLTIRKAAEVVNVPKSTAG